MKSCKKANNHGTNGIVMGLKEGWQHREGEMTDKLLYLPFIVEELQRKH